jgi:hypothetical protein
MDWLHLLLRMVLGLLQPNGKEPQPVAVRPDGTTTPLPPGSLSPGCLQADRDPALPTNCCRRLVGDWRTLFSPFGSCPSKFRPAPNNVLAPNPAPPDGGAPRASRAVGDDPGRSCNGESV